jgi:general secretion pathway protein K
MKPTSILQHSRSALSVPLSNSKGMALLLTLTIVALLVTTTLELNRRARIGIQTTTATRDQLALSQMLESGVQAAMALLVKDKEDSEIDSIQEDWADPEKIEALINSLNFESGQLKLKITDERSRIQVNALVQFPDSQTFNEAQRMLWERSLRTAFLVYEHPDETDPVNTIINSLKDWLDSGDDEAITGLTGAESDYYRDLDPPYACRNGPLTYLSELLRVRAVTPELYYGKDELPGLVNLLTVHGMSDDGSNQVSFDGRVNINTAEIPVLMALLPEENQDLAVAIADYRVEKQAETYSHELSSATWYKEVPGAGDIDIEPDLITTRSDLYRIDVEAQLNGISMAATAVVERERKDETGQILCRALSWEQY